MIYDIWRGFEILLLHNNDTASFDMNDHTDKKLIMRRNNDIKKILLRIFASVAAGVLCMNLSGCQKKLDWGDTVYSTQYYAGNSAYFLTYGNGGIMCSYFAEPDNVYSVCIDPFCHHNDMSCVGWSRMSVSATLVVRPEDRKLPLVYAFSRRYPTEYVDGENVQLDDYERKKCSVKELDAETGQARIIAYPELQYVRSALFYDGRLYMSAEGCLGVSRRVGAVDVVSGECSYLETDTDTAAIGIWRDRVYVINDRGVVYSCALDFSDIREEYDCGIGEKRSEEAFYRAYVDSGILYFEQNCRVVTFRDGEVAIGVLDVYAVRLDDIASGESRVAEGVLNFKPCEGDLYYNVLDYEEYGTVNIDGDPGHDVVACSYDGGAVMRYDRERGESETCFSDCGISFLKFYDVADGKILFEGMQYKNVEECRNWYLVNYICVCDIETGEWSVVCHAPDPQ